MRRHHSFLIGLIFASALSLAPLVFADTIGYLNVAANPNSLGANVADSMVITATTTGTLGTMSMYIHSVSAGTTFKGVIWDHNTGAVVGVSLPFTAATGWQTEPFVSSPSIVSGTTYNFGVVAEGSSEYVYDSPSAPFDREYQNVNNYANPTVFSASGSNMGYSFSLYATFAGSPAPAAATSSAPTLVDFLFDYSTSLILMAVCFLLFALVKLAHDIYKGGWGILSKYE